MALEFRTFTVTTPSGVLPAAPQVTQLAMPARIVKRIEWVIPPGPNGALGFALGAAGQPVIPYNAGAFIVTSDEKDGWDIEGGIESGAWEAFTYNTGLLPHTFYLRFLLDTITATTPAAVTQVIPPALLAPMTADDLAALGLASPNSAASLTVPPLSTVTS